MHTIEIPFSGFYDSIHDDVFERVFEYLYDQYADETGKGIPESLLNRLWMKADFANAHNLYASGTYHGQ